MLDDRFWRGGLNLDQTEILLGGEALAGFRGEGRRGDCFDKELCDFSGGFRVNSSIDADDTSKSGDGIGGEGFLVGLKDCCSGGCAAGVCVFDDDDGGLVKLLGQFPAGVEINEVVEAQLFALKLGCTGDTQAGAVRIKSGALVRVFPVAEGLG